jgi:hypothetical protein
MNTRIGVKPSIDIVIINWNSSAQLNRGLESIAMSDQRTIQIGRIIIVDNASMEFFVREEFKKTLPIEIIINPANVGFAAACNQGAKICTSQYLLFLNPDVRINADSISTPVRWMDTDGGDVGICGIRLFNKGGRCETSCADFPRLSMYLVAAIGIDKLLPHRRLGRFHDASELDADGYVDQVSGAFFLVRRKVYEFLGGFDERFFVYYEEVDFSLRARQKGYPSYYLSRISAGHIGGTSTGQAGPRRLFYYLQSRLKYAKKHFRPLEYLALSVLTLGPEFFMRLSFSLWRGSRELTETLAAYRMLWGWIVEENVGCGGS